MTNEQRQEIIRQIGNGNIFAISGGRVRAIEDGIELPISSGYRVRVILTPADLYRVERVMVRGQKTFHKGHIEDVFCEDVGDLAYYASCFRNDSSHSGRWVYGNPAANEVAA